MNINLFLKNDKEKPLDNLVVGGGFCSIFRKIVCIGDSLSSGEFELLHSDNTRTYHDYFPYSWGQYIAREAGVEVLNYSRGGMSTKEYCETFADAMGFWNQNVIANAYIIALGVNDLNMGLEMGSISDIDKTDWKNNKKTFVGYYGQIIQRYKNISKNAKIFLVTMPYLNKDKQVLYDNYNNAIRELANYFEDCYLIDLFTYGPDYLDKTFNDNFFLNGHLTPTGYCLTAKMMMSYIDYIVRNNYQDFKYVGFTDINLIKTDINLIK